MRLICRAHTDSSSSAWTLADDIELCLGNLAVLAFYSLMRVSLDPAQELQRGYFARRKKAIELARQTREQIIALRDQPGESIIIGFQRVAEILVHILAQLGPPSQEELLAIFERMQASEAK